MTEMWERFSFYGMRALLVLYLIAGGPTPTAAWAMDHGHAPRRIYSVYIAMVYLLPMPGGWLGDRVWGPRKTVAIAVGVIMLGHAHCWPCSGDAALLRGTRPDRAWAPGC